MALQTGIMPILGKQYQAAISGKKATREEAENFRRTATGAFGGMGDINKPKIKIRFCHKFFVKVLNS